MKKFIRLNIAMLVILLAASSCERKYTCLCVYPGSNISTSRTSYKAKRRSDAEAMCSNQNIAARKQGGSCALE